MLLGPVAAADALLTFLLFCSPLGACMLAFLGVVPAKLWEFPRTTSAKALEPCSMFSGGGATLTEINSVGVCP